jgi:hypothetical protein
MKAAQGQLAEANELSKGVGLAYCVFFLTLSGVLLAYDWWTAQTILVQT